jgi:histidinol phosphatase-like enzyme
MLYLFDLDGTLIETFLKEDTCPVCNGSKKSHGVRCAACNGRGVKIVQSSPEAYDEVVWLPDRFEVLRDIAAHDRWGGTSPAFGLVTNQTGASYGYQTERQVNEKLLRVQHEFYRGVGAPLDAYACRNYRDAENRKPAPGLIHQARCEHPMWPTHQIVVVGDLDSDRLAAQAAGVAFAWADSFFAN